MHKVPRRLKSGASLTLASEEGQVSLRVCADLQFTLTVFSLIVKQVATKFICVLLFKGSQNANYVCGLN